MPGIRYLWSIYVYVSPSLSLYIYIARCIVYIERDINTL